MCSFAAATSVRIDKYGVKAASLAGFAQATRTEGESMDPTSVMGFPVPSGRITATQ